MLSLRSQVRNISALKSAVPARFFSRNSGWDVKGQLRKIESKIDKLELKLERQICISTVFLGPSFGVLLLILKENYDSRFVKA